MFVQRTLYCVLVVAVVTAEGEHSSNLTAEYERIRGTTDSFLDLNLNNSFLLRPKNFKHELPPVPNSEELEEWIGEQFELLNLDYKKFLQNMDRELEVGRQSSPGRRRQVDKASWLLELVRTVPEVNIYRKEEKCNACRAGLGLMLHYLRESATTDELKMIGYSFCVSIKMQTPRICKADMDIFMDEAVYIMKRISLTPKEICSFILDNQCGEFDNSDYKWNVTLPPGPKPPVKPFVTPTTDKPSFKVLHLSDTHYDPLYLEGTNAECNEPLCCRRSNGPARSAEKAAGRWGDYRACDLPRSTIKSMLDHISSTHPDIDYVIWTGDAYPHNSLNVSKEDYAAVLKETVDMLCKVFPNTPIFPALGNHDTLPPNFFPSPSYNNISWLYEVLDNRWSQMLLNYSDPSVNHGAFYSIQIRPGFRIISLNTLYGFSKNGWLLLNSTDPGNMLAWFINELHLAEKNGEKVHVIGHIPPGQCLKEWSRNYNQIVNRYESTITAQFFGHTHMDNFEVFYDTEDKKRAISVAYIGPSVTPFINVNPSYRIYYVDGDHSTTTRSVIDHETWALNLNYANLYNSPIWYKLYSTRSAYKMQSLSPQDWDNFIIKMAKDPDLFDLFYAHYSRNSTLYPKCDTDCKKKLLCDLRSGRSQHRQELCQEIESIVGASVRIHLSSLVITFSVIVPVYSLVSRQLDF
ncbi:sphingomyelin phosphodiesterase [Anabrus simplex]|uniref:sphingomyelin phosphodiesterase n=1 Tax=Anabrus simplex TaxID=316456 RepID=UPI0035A26BCF